MHDILSEEDVRSIQDILIHELGVEREQLTPETRLVDDFGADSLTLVEITIAIEGKFNVAIPDDRWERVRTVGDLLETLAELLPEQRR